MIEVSRQTEFNIHSVVDLIIGLSYAMFYSSVIVAHGPDLDVNTPIAVVHLFMLMIGGVILTPLSMYATYKLVEIVDDVAWKHDFNKDIFHSRD